MNNKQFVAKGEAFDYRRLARMAAFGFLFHGTISHFFYNKVYTHVYTLHSISFIYSCICVV
jgi:uncharacterized protein (DUF2252 family)